MILSTRRCKWVWWLLSIGAICLQGCSKKDDLDPARQVTAMLNLESRRVPEPGGIAVGRCTLAMAMNATLPEHNIASHLFIDTLNKRQVSVYDFEKIIMQPQDINLTIIKNRFPPTYFMKQDDALIRMLLKALPAGSNYDVMVIGNRNGNPYGLDFLLAKPEKESKMVDAPLFDYSRIASVNYDSVPYNYTKALSQAVSNIRNLPSTGRNVCIYVGRHPGTDNGLFDRIRAECLSKKIVFCWVFYSNSSYDTPAKINNRFLKLIKDTHGAYIFQPQVNGVTDIEPLEPYMRLIPHAMAGLAPTYTFKYGYRSINSMPFTASVRLAYRGQDFSLTSILDY